MEKLPLLCKGRPVGELLVTREGEDTLFTANAVLPEKDMWCFWVVGRGGTLRLGCPEEPEGEVCFSRRFSSRMTLSLGSVLRGEARSVSQSERSTWEAAPKGLFRSPGLRQELSQEQGVLTRRWGNVRLIALPFSPEKPFPLTSLFCFANIRVLNGKKYAIFAFDGKEWPIFQSLENL